MRFHQRTFIILLLISFTAGFFISFLIFGRNKSSSSESQKISSIREIKKEASNIEVSYQKQIETLTSQNTELQQQLELSQGLLDVAKHEAKDKENNIQQLIGQIKSPPVDLFQNSFKTNPKTYLSSHQLKLLEDDEIALFSEKADKNYICDSLVKEVSSYIEANHRKDSIYEVQLIQFDSLLSVKDLLTEASKKAYNDLHLLFDKTVLNQTSLQKENIALRKENKQQRFKSKLFASGLMILSGFAAHIFLH